MPPPGHRNVKVRLVVGFALIIGFLVTLAVVSIAGFAALSQAAADLYAHPLQVSNASLRASLGVIKMHRSMKDVAFFSDEETLPDSLKVVSSEAAAVYRNLDVVRDQILGAEGRALEQESRRLFDHWMPIRDKVIRLVQAGERMAAAEITRGEGAAHVALLEANMLSMTAYARRKADGFMAEATAIQRRVLLSTISLALAGILFSLLVAVYTGRRVLSAVAERERAEQSLEKRNALLHTLIQALPDIVYFKDERGRYRLVNSAFGAISEVDPAQVSGSIDADVLHPDLLESSRGSDREVAECGESMRFEEETTDHLGRRLIFETRKAPVRDTEGRLLGLVGTSRNITGLKRTEEELRIAVAAAEEANAAKSKFLANMSHEVRTPMNGILGMIELVLGYPLQPQQKRYLEAAQRSARSLLRIINEVLDLSTIEAGKFELEAKPFDPRQVAEDATEDLSVAAHEKGLELVCDVLPSVPESVVGDAGRLRQVLVNLLGNAVKFTEQGEVVLRVQAFVASGSDDGRCLLEVSVTDTGIGIPSDKLDVLFDSFHQLDGSLTRRHPGTGLGLAITKSIVEMMGGSTRVESEVGTGSRFAITLPTTVGNEARQPDPCAGIAGMRVLLVDDNASSLEALHHALGSLDVVGVSAVSGVEALSYLQTAAETGQRFLMTLVDAGLLEAEGAGLAAQLGQYGQQAGRTVVLTSASSTGTAASVFLADPDWIMKPVTRTQLIRCALEALEPPGELSSSESADTTTGTRTTSSAETEPATGNDASPAILVVEDDAVSRMYIQSMLQRQGFRVTAVGDGNEAVREVGAGDFRLVFMDIQMPGLDGLQATRAIRELEASGNGRIPIVGITAHAMQEDRQRCLDAGMDDQLAKPVDSRRLLAVTRQYLEPLPSPETVVESPVDIVRLLETLGGDRKTLRALVETFQRSARQHLDVIRQSVEAGMPRDAAAAAHTVRGSASLFGATRLVELARRIEQLGEQEALAQMGPVVGEFEQVLERVMESLTQTA